VMMGAERKSLVMTEEEKMLTAYHEGGHAIVALNVKATDPVHKATIIPRGRALGMVMQLPERDKLSMSLEQMTSRLAIMMGGRVAEELVFGKEKVTSGAASDIEQATKLARMMVTRWGLSEQLGTVAYGENQDEVFLGYQVSRQQNISEETSRKIDGEIRRLVEGGYSEAQQILSDKRAELETLAPTRVNHAQFFHPVAREARWRLTLAASIALMAKSACVSGKVLMDTTSGRSVARASSNFAK